MKSDASLPKYLLITGAQGGIGQAMLKKISVSGVKIIAVDIVTEILERDFAIDTIQIERCDITDPIQIKALWSKIIKKGITIDCLINNAAIYPACQWQDYTIELAHKVINTNLVGAFMMSQAFAKQTTKGSIINIASVVAFCGSSDPFYGASKAGLIGLTKSMAANLAPDIRVNSIAPSIVDTPMMANIPGFVLERYKSRELISSVIDPESIVDAAMFLASSSSKHITGSTLDVNNGLYLR